MVCLRPPYLCYYCKLAKFRIDFVTFIAPAGISPRGEIPRRHPSSSLGQYLQFKYTVSILEKISICSNWGHEESLGNDDVSIVCARKYEMVRMT